jgi:hypothetical protein
MNKKQMKEGLHYKGSIQNYPHMKENIQRKFSEIEITSMQQPQPV